MSGMSGMNIVRYTCDHCAETYWTGDYHDCPYDVMPMVLLRSEWQEIIGALRASASRVGACGGDMQMRVGSWRTIASAIERNLDNISDTVACVKEWIEKQ